jgi:hypothetical protein
LQLSFDLNGVPLLRPLGSARVNREFESTLSVDAQARAAIMRQVCDHGLGLFRMIPDEQFHQERLRHERAA